MQPSAASMSATPTKVVTETIRLLTRAIERRDEDAGAAAPATAADDAEVARAPQRGAAHGDGDEDGGGGDDDVAGATSLECVSAPRSDGSTDAGGTTGTWSRVVGCDVELLTSFRANNAEKYGAQLAP